MKIIKRRHSPYTHYVEDQVSIPINEGGETEPFSLYIVYFINTTCNANYLDWLTCQIKEVASYTDNIYIVATLNAPDEALFRQQCREICPKAVVGVTFVNQYEYPGILKVWELAQTHRRPNDIILYFHSKGLTHHSSYSEAKEDKYQIILKDMAKIYDIFTTFPTIDKVGFASGKIGWIWYNFWYARGSYLCQVERPIVIERRHYYEDWLGRKVASSADLNVSEQRPHEYYRNTISDCYSFDTDCTTHGNIGSYYCPETCELKHIP